MKGPETVCELFKLLRSQWRSRAEIQRDAGLADKTVEKWCAELVANGMLVQRTRPDHEGRGIAPVEFALAPAWGGQAA
ncbi:hypothetical protein [Aquabacterium sp. OR-4]|uniref:hypothetical protein n=1 Tax=Aquabacterium sp. OR-4 TaxID=2978127 RepID=UPI0021B326DE|nr:hypothetical protein [Aquabacterium sp. OR-4]MDT7834984.1 hypothetical protein [Aquabacterium sp. OR-4]